MMKRMKWKASLVLLACLTAGQWTVAGADAAQPTKAPTAQELERMSTFLSNFTELGSFNFDVEKSGGTTPCT